MATETNALSIDSEEYQRRLGAVESAMVDNDLSKLSTEERVTYVRSICDDLGLNWKTQPFQFIVLNKKLTLYARKDCTDQLRRIYGISVRVTRAEQDGEYYVVHAQASTPSGRVDESTAHLWTKPSKAQELGNERMKCETKAKRRATLSICGLGFLDETETDDIKSSTRVDFDQSVQDALTNVETVHAGNITDSELNEARLTLEDVQSLLARIDSCGNETEFNELDAIISGLHVAVRRSLMTILEERAKTCDVVRDSSGEFIWDVDNIPEVVENREKSDDESKLTKSDEIPF